MKSAALRITNVVASIAKDGTCLRSCSSSSAPLKKTALYQFHVSAGAKLVPFSGWEMPVQYPEGVMKEHLHTRTVSSLFDVSHMCQLKFFGKDRVSFIEKLVVGDIAGLSAGHSRLSVFTNEKGGIIDDTMITNAGDHLYVVVNAGCADKDIAHLTTHLNAFRSKGGDVTMVKFSESNSLLAVQGPQTERIVGQLVKEDISRMEFLTQRHMDVSGIPCIVSRCGYTGEDGFEISVPHSQAAQLAEKLQKTTIKPAGLGARDSLRLEAGLCLYGHDINEDITPVEASLTWLIGKRRREEGGFLGESAIQAQLKNPSQVTKKRVGLSIQGAPAREETLLFSDKNQQIGKITSGTFSPSMKQNIAMGYVTSEHSKIGSAMFARVRDKLQPASIVKMPFVPTNYKKL